MIKDILSKASGESLLSDKIQVHRVALEKLDQIVEELSASDGSEELRSQVSEELLIYSEKLDELERKIENELMLKEQYQQEIIAQMFSIKEETKNELNMEMMQKLENFRLQLQEELQKATQNQSSLLSVSDQIKMFLDFQQGLLVESRDGNYNPITGSYSGAWKWATFTVIVLVSLSMGWVIPRFINSNQVPSQPSQQRVNPINPNQKPPEIVPEESESNNQSSISKFGYSIAANPNFDKKKL